MLAERIGSSQLAEMSARVTRLGASVRPTDLPRLRQLVAAGPGVPAAPLAVDVGFQLGPEGFPVVRVQVQGTLHLVCQRCLAPVGWPLVIDVALTVVATDAETGELASPFDSVVLGAEGDLSLRSVVEDEIVAILPLSPLHASEAECQAGVRLAESHTDARLRQTNRPFADLATLLSRQDRDRDD